MPTPAPAGVVQLFEEVKKKHHEKRLGDAEIVVMFNEDKPFKKNRFNWGRVKKCSPETRVLLREHAAMRHDFLVILPDEGWEYLDAKQREAWVDLLLSRCTVEYEPELDGGDQSPPDGETKPKKRGRKAKAKPKKDGMGRIKYTDKPKYDEDGNPKWVVDPLDIHVITENVVRYGAWFGDFKNFQEAVKNG
jgi:hypothetical protein